MVYDTLFAMDSELRPQPQMVGGWTASDDKLTYTFTLRNGLRFHDGQRVRAADVVASLNRWGQRNDAYGQSLLAAAAAIEPIDDEQFRIALKDAVPGARSARHIAQSGMPSRCLASLCASFLRVRDAVPGLHPATNGTMMLRRDQLHAVGAGQLGSVRGRL